MTTLTRCSLTALATVLLSSTALAEKPNLFAQRRHTPRKVRNRADWSPARLPLLGGWLGKRVQRTDATRPTRTTRNKLQQTRVTTHVVPGWGNNQAGVRSFVEVYTDKRSGNPVVRTIQRVKSHRFQGYQYRDPHSGKTGYAGTRAQVPQGADKVKRLGSYWLNTVKVSERRTMALTPRARRAASLIAAAIKAKRALPRSALSYFAEPLAESLKANHKPRSASSYRASGGDDDFMRVGGVSVGGVSVGGVNNFGMQTGGQQIGRNTHLGGMNVGGINVGGVNFGGL